MLMSRKIHFKKNISLLEAVISIHFCCCHGYEICTLIQNTGPIKTPRSGSLLEYGIPQDLTEDLLLKVLGPHICIPKNLNFLWDPSDSFLIIMKNTLQFTCFSISLPHSWYCMSKKSWPILYIKLLKWVKTSWT